MSDTFIDWYNQYTDPSDNGIKKLKLGFKADTLYFGTTTLAYNLFALMRLLAAKAVKMVTVNSFEVPHADLGY